LIDEGIDGGCEGLDIIWLDVFAENIPSQRADDVTQLEKIRYTDLGTHGSGVHHPATDHKSRRWESYNDGMSTTKTIIIVALVFVASFGLTAALSKPSDMGFRQFQVADDIGNTGHYSAPVSGHSPSYGNHGHGNNADGVDSSNPGRGGPSSDESCDGTGECIDDEL
jgi:hypothetical protein